MKFSDSTKFPHDPDMAGSKPDSRPPDSRPIGIFDSGLGGLTVLSAIRKKFPQENLVYFGDTARVPYGSKSRDTVIRYSLEIRDFLVKQGVKMIVAACNTASSHALEELQKDLDIPVIGVVEPGIRALSMALEKNTEFMRNPRAAVIATRSTIKSESYTKALKRVAPQIHLLGKACPLLVPLIEEGFSQRKAAELIIREYLDEIVREDIEYIILGCTHYPLIKDTINRLYPKTSLIDASTETAEEIRRVLEKNGGFNESEKEGYIRLFVSDITDSLLDMEKLFFGGTIDSVKKITLGW